jgi:hypothetical protein
MPGFMVDVEDVGRDVLEAAVDLWHTKQELQYKTQGFEPQLHIQQRSMQLSRKRFEDLQFQNEYGARKIMLPLGDVLQEMDDGDTSGSSGTSGTSGSDDEDEDDGEEHKGAEGNGSSPPLGDAEPSTVTPQAMQSANRAPKRTRPVSCQRKVKVSVTERVVESKLTLWDMSQVVDASAVHACRDVGLDPRALFEPSVHLPLLAQERIPNALMTAALEHLQTKIQDQKTVVKKRVEVRREGIRVAKAGVATVGGDGSHNGGEDDDVGFSE